MVIDMGSFIDLLEGESLQVKSGASELCGDNLFALDQASISGATGKVDAWSLDVITVLSAKIERTRHAPKPIYLAVQVLAD